MSRNNRPRLSLPSSILAGFAFAMPLSAQVASYTYIDQKAPYRNPASGMLTALNLPKIGTTFEVQVPLSVTDIPCVWSHANYDYYYLGFGVSNPDVPIPALGFQFTSAEVILPTPFDCYASSGFVTMSFPIPNTPSLLGLHFYNQVLHHFQSGGGYYAPPDYRVLSRGGVGVIGM